MNRERISDHKIKDELKRTRARVGYLREKALLNLFATARAVVDGSRTAGDGVSPRVLALRDALATIDEVEEINP